MVLITGDAPGCALQQADYGYRFVLLEKPVDPTTLINVVTQAAAD